MAVTETSTSVRRPGLLSKNERGVALVTALLLLTVLTLLGTTAVVISTTDIRIGSNYKTARQAFYDAEAGIHYIIKQIETRIALGSLTLPGTGESVTITYDRPAGFSFGNSAIGNSATLTNIGTNRYKFQVPGHDATENASCTIEVIVTRDPYLNYGIFGNKKVDMKNSGAAYSYDSRTTPSPTPANSTHEADIGSNQLVLAYNNSIIDGNVALGDDGAGNEGVYSPLGGGPTVTGTANLDVPRVTPDPLGIIGGSLATTFFYVESGNNDNVWGGVTGNTISLNHENKTLDGKTGGANYYLTEIDLNHATLDINTTTGRVNIYLNGPLNAGTSSAINITGSPPDFTIYSKSSTSSLIFKNDSTFKGTIYAPYTTVEMKNSADVYGLIWADRVDIKNSGQFYFDTSLKEKFASNDISIVSWREIR